MLWRMVNITKNNRLNFIFSLNEELRKGPLKREIARCKIARKSASLNYGVGSSFYDVESQSIVNIFAFNNPKRPTEKEFVNNSIKALNEVNGSSLQNIMFKVSSVITSGKET